MRLKILLPLLLLIVFSISGLIQSLSNGYAITESYILGCVLILCCGGLYVKRSKYYGYFLLGILLLGVLGLVKYRNVSFLFGVFISDNFGIGFEPFVGLALGLFVWAFWDRIGPLLQDLLGTSEQAAADARTAQVSTFKRRFASLSNEELHERLEGGVVPAAQQAIIDILEERKEDSSDSQ